MPQMAPLMWTSLFIFFTILLLMTMTKILFLNKEIQKTSNELLGVTSKKMNWKW